MLAILGNKLVLYAIGAALLAIVAGGFLVERKLDKDHIAALTAENATLEAANAANVTELAKIQDDAARQIAALKADRTQAELRAAARQTINEEIDHAPPSDDAPVAPVLERAIGRLLGAAAGGGDKGSAGHH